MDESDLTQQTITLLAGQSQVDGIFRGILEGLDPSAAERQLSPSIGEWAVQENARLRAENAELREAFGALAKVYGPISASMRIGSERRLLWDAAFALLAKVPA